MKLEDYFKKYNTGHTGLTHEQVLKNRTLFGTNTITTKKRDSFIFILLTQFGSFFSVVLLCAAFILLFLGDTIEFYVVLIIALTNICIESVQRYKSDSIFESLTKMLPRFSMVIRNGKRKRIESSEIVVGDIVILQSGDHVPVDGLVVSSAECKIDEALLTGESKPVLKNPAQEYSIAKIIENHNIVFSGSHVVTGVAHVLAYQVGNSTQIGLIAQKVSTIDRQLPIYKNIKRLSTQLFIGIMFIAAFVFLIGISRSDSVFEMLKLAVAICVSAIPESLPVTITLILAFGFKRMGDKNVLVKKMQSLDVLGQIDTLALDKTGTITRNQMKVEKVVILGGPEIYITGDGYNPEGTFIHQDISVSLNQFPAVYELVQNATLSSSGSFAFDEEKKEWILEMGDPTEVSLLVLGEKSGVSKDKLTDLHILEKVIPFTNQTMYHSAHYAHTDGAYKIYTGAPEVIFLMATHVQFGDMCEKKNETHQDVFDAKIKEYASGGYRILANAVEKDGEIIFKGIFAINDSIRLDIKDSVEKVYGENIKILIITGDHKDIALQVAKKIGVHATEHSVLTGDQIQNLTDAQLKNILLDKVIFARVTPQQKLKILELLKQLGKVVAMTGDGVNDSLALVKADIGIAMGTLSSESAKAAADIVLLDNKFGSIVYGIEEGKNIFSNIKKTILFLLSTNFAEMALTVLAITLALPLPLSAAGILWVNFVTDTFLAIGFAFERGFVKKDKKYVLVSFKDWMRIFYLGLVMTLISLFVFISNINTTGLYAQSIVLLTLIVMQWFNILNIRAGEQSIFSYGFKINKMFILGWFVSAVLTLFAFSSQFMHKVLYIQSLTIEDLLYAAFFASFVIVFEEIRKLLKKK